MLKVGVILWKIEVGENLYYGDDPCLKNYNHILKDSIIPSLMTYYGLFDVILS